MNEPTGLEHVTPVLITSTSATERAGFRKCRRQWFLTTVHRLDGNKGNVNFFLGNVYHAALAAYYVGQHNGETVDTCEILALDTYQDEFDSQMKTVEDQLGFLFKYGDARPRRVQLEMCADSLVDEPTDNEGDDNLDWNHGLPSPKSAFGLAPMTHVVA